MFNTGRIQRKIVAVAFVTILGLLLRAVFLARKGLLKKHFVIKYLSFFAETMVLVVCPWGGITAALSYIMSIPKGLPPAINLEAGESLLSNTSREPSTQSKTRLEAASDFAGSSGSDSRSSSYFKPGVGVSFSSTRGASSATMSATTRLPQADVPTPV